MAKTPYDLVNVALMSEFPRIYKLLHHELVARHNITRISHQLNYDLLLHSRGSRNCDNMLQTFMDLIFDFLGIANFVLDRVLIGSCGDSIRMIISFYNFLKHNRGKTMNIH